MRKILVRVLRYVLKKLAQATRRRYKPAVIGITGSVGKTSTKEALYAVLGQWRKVRGSQGSFNNEIGFPLTILGSYSDTSGGVFFWAKVIFLGLARLIFKRPYPEILILEYGVGKPGDIDYLLSIAVPNIAVVTVIGETPVHVEFYKGPAQVTEEKTKLVSSLPKNGLAVLNYDDEAVFSMSEKTEARVVTYGFHEGADIRITGFKNQSHDYEPIGIAFNLEEGANFAPIEIKGAFGKGQAYAVAAVSAVGLIFGIDLAKISSLLSFYKPLPGRGRLIRGIKSAYIIDDSYNSSPLAMEEALATLGDLKARRKLAVLGDMSELGQYTASSHERVGCLAAGVAHLLVTVGAKAKFIAEGARKANFPAENILEFDSTEEAESEIQKLLKPGDLILIKGSQVMRMEKLTFKIMENPLLAKELLPRQYGKWIKS